MSTKIISLKDANNNDILLPRTRTEAVIHGSEILNDIIDNIEKVIPSEASSSNQLADKLYVDTNFLQIDGSNTMTAGVKIQDESKSDTKVLVTYTDGNKTEHDSLTYGFSDNDGITVGNTADNLNLATKDTNIYHNKNNELKKIYDEGNLTFSFNSETKTLSITQIQ